MKNDHIIFILLGLVLVYVIFTHYNSTGSFIPGVTGNNPSTNPQGYLE